MVADSMKCADVKLVNTPLSQSDYSNDCKNNTGIKVSQDNISGNPNGTSTDASSSASPSSSSSATAASPSSSTGAAAQVKAASWVLGAVGVAGIAML